MADRLGLRSIDEERLNLLSNQPVPEAADIDTTNPGPTLSPNPRILLEKEPEGPGFFDRLGDRLGGLLPDRDQLAQAGDFLLDVGIHAGDFGAGFLGIESPSEKLAKQRQLVNERESRQLKNAIEAQNFLKKTVDQANALPIDKREQFVESQKELLRKLRIPEETIEAAFEMPQILDTPFFEVPEVKSKLTSVDAGLKFVNSKEGTEALAEFNDQKNLPDVQEKLAQMVRETGRRDMTFPEIQAWNKTADSDKKFTSGQLGTLKRNQDDFTGLMETTDEAKTRGRERIKAAEKAKGGTAQARIILSDGTVIEAGPVAANKGMMDAVTNRKLEENIQDSFSALANMNAIASNFDERFLTTQARAAFAMANQAEKFGIPLPENVQQFVADFQTFKQDTATAVNAEINRLSGAAVSPDEAKRLEKQLVDAVRLGPTAFNAAMQNVQRKLRLGIARLFIQRREGLQAGSLSFDEVETRMKVRAAEVANERVAAGFTAERAKEIAKEVVRAEFGVGIR